MDQLPALRNDGRDVRAPYRLQPSRRQHAPFFPPFGIYPNNAIVGGSAPLATGAASTTGFRFSQVWWSPASAMLPRAPVQSGSPSTSPPWRSSRRSGSRAPRQTVVFFVVNNFYGMGRQTIGETMAYERLARIGAGINPENMHAQTIDGNNPLAVIDAMITARDIDGGDGPVLIDCQTYRLSGHSPSDASSYRTKDELIFGRQRIRSLPTSIGLYRAA